MRGSPRAKQVQSWSLRPGGRGGKSSGLSVAELTSMTTIRGRARARVRSQGYLGVAAKRIVILHQGLVGTAFVVGSDFDELVLGCAAPSPRGNVARVV